MDSQVFVVFQEESDGIAQAANADLKCGAVLDERNDFIRNGFFYIRNRDLGQLGDLMVLFADIINVLNVDESFLRSVNERRFVVHLQDNRAGAPGGGVAVKDSNRSKAKISVLIRGCDVRDEHGRLYDIFCDPVCLGKLVGENIDVALIEHASLYRPQEYRRVTDVSL